MMSGITLEKRTSKKCTLLYSNETFPMYDIWLKKFLSIYQIGNNLEKFYKILYEKFFEWLNQPKNSSKFMFEIKKEFMSMADEVLLFEIIFDRLKKKENHFIIPVFQKESESDVEIDSYPDQEPFYNLIEESQVSQEYIIDSDSDIEIDSYPLIEEIRVSQEYISDIESSECDEDYYISFFL